MRWCEVIFINFCFIVFIHIQNDQVYIEQLGANTSFINQIPISTTDKQILKDGDKLYLLKNEHGYIIRIERSDANNELIKKVLPVKTTLKRQNTNDDDSSLKKQKVLINKIEQEEEKYMDDSSEENRLTWIQQQLDALQATANPSYVSQTRSKGV
jgi:hypothetical protein